MCYTTPSRFEGFGLVSITDWFEWRLTNKNKSMKDFSNHGWDFYAKKDQQKKKAELLSKVVLWTAAIITVVTAEILLINS